MINANMELSSVDKKIANMASNNMQEMEELFVGLIKEGQTKGEITKKYAAKALARHLFNSLTGLRMTGMNRPEQDALREVVKLAMAILDE